jgi:hypothetical protein
METNMSTFMHVLMDGLSDQVNNNCGILASGPIGDNR